MHPKTGAVARPRLAVHAALIAAAAALWLYAWPAPAADAPSKSDTSTQSTTDKPSGTVTSPPAAQPDAGEDKDSASDNATKRAKRRYRIDRDLDFIDEDPDLRSLRNAVHTAPWIVGIIFLVVGSIFLTPVILLVGIILYKLRKTRMQNEAWLRLAEKGVVAPALAAEAVASGLPPPETPAVQTAASGTGSPVQHAVEARRRAVWSDLRKGVVMFMIGLALCFYSLLNYGSANWIGLVLLFLGIGYVVLWWFEDRHLAQRGAGTEAGSR